MLTSICKVISCLSSVFAAELIGQGQNSRLLLEPGKPNISFL